MHHQRLHLRPVRPSDEPFLLEVFCSTRPDVVHADLPQREIDQFLRMQFIAQRDHYQRAFPDAVYSVIYLDQVRIGRLYVHYRTHEVRILDIALLPSYRNQGHGSTLVSDILREAQYCHKPVRIHVEIGGREVQFYQRLGFVKIGEIPTHHLMECSLNTPMETLMLRP